MSREQLALFDAPVPEVDAVAAGLRRLADLVQRDESTTPLHEAGAHVRRAAAMVRSGDVAESLCYLRTLARNALGQRRAILRSPYGRELGNRMIAQSRADRAVVYVLALRHVQRLGVASRWLTRWPSSGASDVAVDVFDLPIGAAGKVAGYARQITNPHWPDLGSCGVWVDVDQRQRGGYWVELQAYPGDEERSQLVVTRSVPDRERALEVARALAELGEAVVAAAVVGAP